MKDAEIGMFWEIFLYAEIYQTGSFRNQCTEIADIWLQQN